MASATSTSTAEVLSVSPRGLWLLVGERDFFLPHEQFPWFADARVRDVCRVELQHGHVLHWPVLDIDLELESLEHPEAWPLVWRP